MLSESERRRLDELETLLMVDDPRLAARLSGHRLTVRRPVWPILTITIAVLAIATTVVGLIAHDVPVAVIGLCAIGIDVGVALGRHARFH